MVGLQERGLPWEAHYSHLRKRLGEGLSWWGGTNGNNVLVIGLLGQGDGVLIKDVQVLVEDRMQKAPVEVEGIEVVV